ALSPEPVSILCCPDEHAFANAARAMTGRCERRKDWFCILQSPQASIPTSTHAPPVQSTYAAYYYPWITVAAPGGAGQLVAPPCGHVAGVYARTDIERGVWTAPAGVALNGVTALSDDVHGSDADQLASRGIDVLRRVPGRGIVVWSARTTSADQDWKYV